MGNPEWVALAGAVVLCAGVGIAAQERGLPRDVTPAMIEEGRAVFRGAGLCGACHGRDGTGVLGPSLADTLWLHSTGSYEEIVRQIVTGVPQSQARGGVMMPPRGGSTMSDAQVRAVAAYVWRLSHPAT